MNLKNKVCIITGASGGIGKAIVSKLVKEDAILVLAARRTEVLEELKASFEKSNHILCVKCDVTRKEDLNRLVQQTLDHFGKIDVLINGAGVSSQYPFWKQPEDDIEKLMYTNYFSYVMLARLVVPYMKKANSGHIINITSGSVMVDPPPRNFIVYTSLKVALRAFAKGLFWEMRDFGIKVTSIFPGVTETPLTNKLSEVTCDSDRLCSTESIADTVAFALSVENNANPLELSVINQKTPWTKPVIPFKQDHPEK